MQTFSKIGYRLQSLMVGTFLRHSVEYVYDTCILFLKNSTTYSYVFYFSARVCTNFGMCICRVWHNKRLGLSRKCVNKLRFDNFYKNDDDDDDDDDNDDDDDDDLFVFPL